MAASHSRQTAVAPRVDALPLRSLTPVWIALAVFALALGAVVVRGVVTKSAAKARASAPAAPVGPTKRQVRERQEHIALTERALDLARKERKAAADKATGATSALAPPATVAPATVAPAPEGAAPSSGSAPAKAKGDQSSPVASTPQAPAAAEPASPKPASPKPASSGLDAMRADIAAQFE